MSTAAPLDRIGVGIDTARYGHRVCFLRPDRLPAAKPLTVLENQIGYHALQQRLEQLHQQHSRAHFHIRIDAAGQYAANLEAFLRALPFPKTITVGDPARNNNYRKAIFPKRKADPTESYCAARFALVEQPPETPDTPTGFQSLREIVQRLRIQCNRICRRPRPARSRCDIKALAASALWRD